MSFTYRLAQISDVEDIKSLMKASIQELQKAFLTQQELEASHESMGLDMTLIKDQTYFVILHAEGTENEVIVGCGGWGKRGTLFGGDHSAGRSEEYLDPKIDPARIRAMYTHPDWARRGVGRLILNIAETAAKEAGFTQLVMGATLAGQPLYEACGFEVDAHIVALSTGGVWVPLLEMSKDIKN